MIDMIVQHIMPSMVASNLVGSRLPELAASVQTIKEVSKQ